MTRTAATDEPVDNAETTQQPLHKTLRAGVIGLGWAGQQHMVAYDAHPEVDLVAIAGLEDRLRHELGETHGIDPELRFADYADLLAHADLDLVTVATPTVLHAPMAVAALRAGIHTLSEKPLAENAGQGAEMVRAAQEADRVLDVSFNHRRRGDVKALKQLLDDGLLGDIYYAKAGWLRRSGIPGLGTWFTKQAVSGGGPLMDIGIHMLDMALHLLGEPAVEAVTAATYAEFGPRGRGGALTGPYAAQSDPDIAFEVEDFATAFVRLAGGSSLLLEASWASYVEQDQLYLTLYGSEGGAVLGNDPTGWTVPALTVFTEVKGVPATLRPLLLPSGGHAEAVNDFVAKVQSPNWSTFRGQEYLTRAAVIDAAYESAATRREVRLDHLG